MRGVIVRPVPVRSIPNSTNTWEAIYDVPPMSDAEKNEMIENPFEVRAQPHTHTHTWLMRLVAVRAEPERLLLLRGGQAHHAHKSRVRLHTKLTCHVTPQKTVSITACAEPQLYFMLRDSSCQSVALFFQAAV